MCLLGPDIAMLRISPMNTEQLNIEQLNIEHELIDILGPIL